MPLQRAKALKKVNKKKIINDPVYGFLQIPHELLYDLLQHPYFQRLRRIKQVGMTYLVYPGAMHSRYNHALGAMYLMQKAIQILRSKGQEITDEEALGAYVAILLHDIGHGPFSHALEYLFIDGVRHEEISLRMMEEINVAFKGQLDTAISIFKGSYPKRFLHQLVSSQLDMDRLDYLTRDSFFTGVSEGVVSWDRIINMLDVRDDQLVVEEKGIYSIEKFIIARRLMYWQVYLHKTVLAAEFMISKIMQRAQALARAGEPLFGTPALLYFFQNKIGRADFESHPEVIARFAELDDNDLFSALKVWAGHPDPILSQLCDGLMHRRLNRVYLFEQEPAAELVADLAGQVCRSQNISPEDLHYWMQTGFITNDAYVPATDKILILRKNGDLKDVTDLSDNLNLKTLSKTVVKHYISLPKEIKLPIQF
ncbi:MAG: HD domain-containing protein [Sphingobacteriaceae bacterium]|nr:HD domain-containing protein [Sphingobacteriaceae bacterium]